MAELCMLNGDYTLLNHIARAPCRFCPQPESAIADFGRRSQKWRRSLNLQLLVSALFAGASSRRADK